MQAAPVSDLQEWAGTRYGYAPPRLPNFYRPHSEASEGYVFKGICLSKLGGGGGQTSTTPPLGQAKGQPPTPPAGQRSTTYPQYGTGQRSATYTPPRIGQVKGQTTPRQVRCQPPHPDRSKVNHLSPQDGTGQRSTTYPPTMVKGRVVCILLECNLVFHFYAFLPTAYIIWGKVMFW